MPCSVARTLEVVGEWWTVLVVRDAIFRVGGWINGDDVIVEQTRTFAGVRQAEDGA